MSRRVLLLLALVLLSWLNAALVSAHAVVRPALHWTRAADAQSCIDPRALALRVTALTGDVLVEPTAATLSVEGQIEQRAEGQFVVRVTSSNTDGVTRGERTLEQAAKDCRELDEAIAFLVALLIDPDLALERLPAELVALGAEGPAPEQELLAELERAPAHPYVLNDVHDVQAPSSVAAPLPARATRVRLDYEASAGAVLDVRTLPRASLGAVAGFVYLPLSVLALEAQLRVARMLGTEAIGDGRAVSAASYTVAMLACGRADRSRWIMEACAGPELSFVQASGRGFDANKDATLRAWGAQIVLGAGRFVSERWAVRARITGIYRPSPPRFEYERTDGFERVFEVRTLNAIATLFASYSF